MGLSRPAVTVASLEVGTCRYSPGISDSYFRPDIAEEVEQTRSRSKGNSRGRNRDRGTPR